MTFPIASLGMYDLSQLRPATDALWRGLSRQFRRVGITPLPRALNRSVDYVTSWRSPNLVFSQTCGYPLTHAFDGRLTYLATPVYDAPGCVGPYYSSAILVRETDSARDIKELQGRVLAINGWDSQSGMNCLRPLCAPLAAGGKFFGEIIVSGGHVHSMYMVQKGAADVCAIDAVTFALVGQVSPARTAGLRLLQWSSVAPALPYVSVGGLSPGTVDRFRHALVEWIRDPQLSRARQKVRLLGLGFLEPEAYDVIPEMREEAERQGYYELHAVSAGLR